MSSNWREAAIRPNSTRALVIDWIAGHKGEFSTKDVADALDLELGVVSYHVRMLRDRGLLRETRQKFVRGSVQRFYERTDA